MSVLYCIGSSSHGNGYIINADGDRLLLECGVHKDDILSKLAWNVNGVSALCSHRHKDHSLSIPALQKYCINVYSNEDVALAYPSVIVMKPRKMYAIGNFKVMPLEVEHNVPNFAYVIDHPKTGRIVFATDCVDFPYNIKGITTLMLECNYTIDTLQAMAENGEVVLTGNEHHMEIKQFLNVVRRLNQPTLQRVVLLHLSDRFSCEHEYIKQTKNIVGGVDVYAANCDVDIPLDKNDF